MSKNEQIEKIKFYADRISLNHTNSREALLFDDIKNFREFMMLINDNDRVVIVPMIHEYKLDELLLEIVREYKDNSYNFLEEITNIFISLTSIEDMELLSEIASIGVIPIFEEFLSTKNKRVLENILWVFLNIVFDNYFYRNIYEEIGLLEKITSTCNNWNNRFGSDIGINDAYCRLLQTYFAVSPFLGYDKMKPYLEIIMDMFVNINKTHADYLEKDCLKFINNSIIFTEQEDINELATKVFWKNLLVKLVHNLAATDMDIVTYSIQILANLACSDNPQQFEVLINSPFFKFIDQLCKNNYSVLEKDLLILIGNIMTYGDHYIIQLIDLKIIYILLEGFSRTIYNKDAMQEYLRAFRNIFMNTYSMKLAQYMFENKDIIDLFIEKIDLSESKNNLILICTILKSIYVLAENYRDENNSDAQPETNFVYDHITQNDSLASKLEMIQQHSSQEVYIEYANFIEFYF